MISGGAWSELPISGILDSDDVSEPNPLTDLLSDPKAKLAFMVRAQPWDPDAGAIRDVFVSSDGYATIDDGAGLALGIADHTPFPGSLASAYSVKVNLISGGSWAASAVPGFGSIVIANPDGQHDDLTKLNWEMREVTAWVGRRQWIGPSFRTLGRVFHGMTDGCTWNTSQITLPVRDMRQSFDVDINPDAYLGFGTAVRMKVTGDVVTIPYGAWTRPLDVDSNPVVAVEVMVQAPVAQDSIIATQGGLGGWACWLFADGAVGLYDRGSTHWIRSAGGKVLVGRPTRLGYYASAEGLAIRVDGVVVVQDAIPYGGPPITDDIIIGGLHT